MLSSAVKPWPPRFEAAHDQPSCVSFRPDPHAEASHIVIGFSTGWVRVFVEQVENAKMLHEYQQHRVEVASVCFMADGELLLSLGADENVPGQLKRFMTLS